MNKIIKCIKNPNLVIIYLMEKGLFNWINDKLYLKIKYYLTMKMKLDLSNPQTFNEKMQWLKLNDRKPEYTNMVDKYEAKEYVKNIIGEQYIIPTLGVWDKFDDIEFEKLPNKFVLKPTHTSGNIYICKDKSNIDYKELKKIINYWQKRKYYYYHREWPYKNVKPRIIAEKYMATVKQPELVDYKFFCFNGEPKFLYVSEGLSDHSTAKISFADMDYKLAEFHRSDYESFNKLPDKPLNFAKMKELARKLSYNIPFVRTDFYEIEGKIYFGELTFYPCTGYIPFDPEKYDKILGDMLELPKEKIEEKNEK